MTSNEHAMVDEIVKRFRRRLLEARVRMRHARTPRAFFDAEREVHDLGRELADAFTAGVLEEVAADDERARDATERIRERAKAKGI